MESIDKNDVDITKLFGWRGKLTLLDKDQNSLMDVYIRLAGDADINRSRVRALRESAKLRKDLKDENNLDRLAYITPKELIGSREDLIDILISIKSRDLFREAINNTKLNVPKEPKDDATLEEQEAYQKLVDEWPKERDKKVTKYIMNKTVEIKKEYEGKTFDELYKEYENQIIDISCEFRMLETFRDTCIFLNSYKDENYKQKLFNDVEEYENLPTDVKNQFREFYLSLEIGTEDLKK